MAIGCSLDFDRHQTRQNLMAPEIAVYREECYTSLLLPYVETNLPVCASSPEEGNKTINLAQDKEPASLLGFAPLRLRQQQMPTNARCVLPPPTCNVAADAASPAIVLRLVKAHIGPFTERFAFKGGLPSANSLGTWKKPESWNCTSDGRPTGKSLYFGLYSKNVLTAKGVDAYKVVASEMCADINIERTLADLGGPWGPSGCDYLGVDHLILADRPDIVATVCDRTSEATKMTALELRFDWERFFKSSVQKGTCNYIHPLSSQLS
ncbi:hypothetical protein K438DRAFT_1772556 [Mycena galopus ATCC 62051]|nr:hypothetical protein K438DRAFT_1772556 [Mycena galopus ATCC 62051]